MITKDVFKGYQDYGLNEGNPDKVKYNIPVSLGSRDFRKNGKAEK